MYDALLEALKAGDTVISCSQFKEKFDEILLADPEKEGLCKLEQQFQVHFFTIKQNLESLK